jgi:hypothetical protein
MNKLQTAKSFNSPKIGESEFISNDVMERAIERVQKYDFTQYRTSLGFQKSKRYLKWMKGRNPHLDLHHILGSVHGKKFTDYLVVPIEHNHHLYVVEPHKGIWFDKYFESAMMNLKGYAHIMLGIDWVDIDTHLLDFEPESVRDFIIYIHAKDIK